MTENSGDRPAVADERAAAGGPSSREPVQDGLRRDIELFLYRDADLLDQWRLHEWLETFAPDGEYLVPSTDNPDGDPGTDLFLVSDDRFLLEQRVNSLLTRAAHAEYPHSTTRRLVSNVQAWHVDAADSRPATIEITANFVVYRSRTDVFDTYVGTYRCVVVRDAHKGFVFLSRRVELALDTLRPHGKLSIIL